MFKNIRLIASFILFFFISSYSFAENKILFIDLEYIYSNSNVGKKIVKKIKSDSKKINEEFVSYQKIIKDKKDDLIKQKNILSEDELLKKSINLDKEINKYNVIINKKNNELAIYANKNKAEFSKLLVDVVQNYAKENSIEMIIKKTNILIGKNNLDATQDVLKLVDKNIKNIKIQ